MSPSYRDWMLNIVANELSLRGWQSLNIEQLAAAGGMNARQARELFPDRRALMLALVKEIRDAHREYIFSRLPGAGSPRERLIRFIAEGLDFCDNQPTLAQAVTLALLGSDALVKEKAQELYAGLFALFLDDLQADGVIPNQSFALRSDLSEVLLSVLFLGGCPRLQMEYLSFVDPRSVALSTLEAMKRRYMATATLI
ncbi:MAG: hypothetical protein L0Z70_08650 [Chloroflexi bacterium]|nr:hypothetical protein [Chloroflexota bacterium]